jgi:hypothetical protein
VSRKPVGWFLRQVFVVRHPISIPWMTGAHSVLRLA